MEKTISFRNLEDYNDSNSVVWTALVMRDEDMQPMNEWFHQIGFIPEGKNLIDWKKVSGNVMGDQGRSDILLIFDREDLQFNPIVRLQIGEIKWTSDFIDNFRKDYYYE